ncbi:unnamed protein product [Eretmochelys imbricata]
MRNGKDILVEKDSSGILPNADGTYYMQSSLEISLQEEDRHRYACRVEHSSLAEPALVWAPGKKGPLPLWVLASITLAALVLAGAVGASVTLWRRKSAGPWRPSYALAATKIGEVSASRSSSGTDIQSMGARSYVQSGPGHSVRNYGMPPPSVRQMGLLEKTECKNCGL